MITEQERFGARKKAGFYDYFEHNEKQIWSGLSSIFEVHKDEISKKKKITAAFEEKVIGDKKEKLNDI